MICPVGMCQFFIVPKWIHLPDFLFNECNSALLHIYLVTRLVCSSLKFATGSKFTLSKNSADMILLNREHLLSFRKILVANSNILSRNGILTGLMDRLEITDADWIYLVTNSSWEVHRVLNSREMSNKLFWYTVTA